MVDVILAYQRLFYQDILETLYKQSKSILLTMKWVGLQNALSIMVERETYCLQLAKKLVEKKIQVPSPKDCQEVAQRIHHIQRKIKFIYNPINFDYPPFLQERESWVKWRTEHFHALLEKGGHESTYQTMVRETFETRENYVKYIDQQNEMDARCFKATVEAAHPMMRKMVQKQTDLSKKIMAQAFLNSIDELWTSP